MARDKVARSYDTKPIDFYGPSTPALALLKTSMTGERRFEVRSKRIDYPSRNLSIGMLKKLCRALIVNHWIQTEQVVLGQLCSAIDRQIPNGVVPN